MATKKQVVEATSRYKPHPTAQCAVTISNCLIYNVYFVCEVYNFDPNLRLLYIPS